MNGAANRNAPAEWNRRERRPVRERKLEGMGPSVQGQGLAYLHWSTESSSIVNMERQNMGADAGKWVDVVKGVWRNLTA